MFKSAIYAILLSGLWVTFAEAHTINYQVENRGISARVFYAGDEPASYSQYEIFGPGDRIPHQKGRTDRNGFVSFLPDRKGKWVIKVFGEAEHGIHAAQIELDVNENLFMASFRKPLVAQYTKGFVGGSIILALFGGWALLRTRKNNVGYDCGKATQQNQ
jgi:nickel transport protein